MTYRCESFIKTPLARNAVIYACATCFSEQLMKEIGDKIAAHKGGARLSLLIKGKKGRTFAFDNLFNYSPNKA